MKKILAFFLLILSGTTYGQAVSGDSKIKVIYTDNQHSEKNPGWFVNGHFVGKRLTIIDPKAIENINPVKTDTIIDGTKYYGQIRIQTKSDYQPKLTTLASLKVKYINSENHPVLFMIDGDIINDDYDKHVVDENYILQIEVDRIENVKENIDIKLVKLLSKTEKNIEKSKRIMIRGNAVALNE